MLPALDRPRVQRLSFGRWGAAAALAATVAAAAALRLYGLTREGLWLDEAISVRRASGTLAFLFHQTVIDDVHPPLYYLLLHVWMKLFGTAEWSVRMPSVLAAVATVVAAYRVGRLVFDRGTGLLAALLVGVSVYHAHHAQDARMYALVALLTTLSMLALVRWTLAGGRRHASAYVVATTLLLYTHVYGLFVLMAQQAFAAASVLRGRPGRPALRQWLMLQGAVALLFAPWAVVMVSHVARVHREFWIPPPAWESLPRTFRLYAGSTELLAALVALAAGGYLLAWTRRRRAAGAADAASDLTPGEKAVLMGAWLAAPILVPLALSLSVAAIFLPRYTIAASVAFYLVLAAGIRRLHPVGRAAAVALLIGLALPQFARWYSTPQKEQWREAVQYIEQRAEAGDRVLFNADYVLLNAYAYYARRSDLVREVVDAGEAARLRPDALRPYALGGRPRVWAVVSRDNDAARLLRTRLPKVLSVAERRRLVGVEVLLFEASPRRQEARPRREDRAGPLRGARAGASPPAGSPSLASRPPHQTSGKADAGGR